MNQMSRVYQFALDKLRVPFLARLAACGLRAVFIGRQRLAGLRHGSDLPPGITPEASRERLNALYPQPASHRCEGKMPPANGMDVSVIIPVWNAQATLDGMLDTLFSQQTEFRFEIIAVDDGSTDGSGALLDRRAEADRRLRVIHKPNGGAASARNAGLDAAGGEYIFFADADDQVLPGAIQSMTAMARQNRLDLVQSAWRYQGGPVQRLQDEILTEERLMDMVEMPGMPWAKLIRRDLFAGVRFPEGFNCFEDSIIKCLLLPKCRRIGLCSCVSYGWLRNNPTGLTATSRFAPKTIQAYWVIEEMERLNERQPDLLGLAILLQQICSVMMQRLKPFDTQVKQDAFLLCCGLVERYRTAPDFPSWKKRLPFPQQAALKAIENRSLAQAIALEKNWRLMV